MELHSQALNFLYGYFILKRKIEKVCNIDVSSDEHLVHPPCVCDKCRRQLQRKYKEKQTYKEIKTNSIPTLHWAAHSDLCQICQHFSEQGNDSSEYVKKCSDIFTKHGYVRITSQDGVLIHCVKVISDAEKLFSTIKIFTDKTFSIHVLGKLISSNTIVEEHKLSSPNDSLLLGQYSSL